MTKVQTGWLCYSASAAILLVAVIATYVSLAEAYGSGPPYFGRTENMDKWRNPVPVLVIVDLACVAVSAVLWRIGSRLLHSSDA